MLLLTQLTPSLELSGINKHGAYFDVDMEKIDCLTSGEFIRILLQNNGETDLTFLSLNEDNHPNHGKDIHIKGIATVSDLYQFGKANSIQ